MKWVCTKLYFMLLTIFSLNLVTFAHRASIHQKHVCIYWLKHHNVVHFYEPRKTKTLTRTILLPIHVRIHYLSTDLQSFLQFFHCSIHPRNYIKKVVATPWKYCPSLLHDLNLFFFSSLVHPSPSAVMSASFQATLDLFVYVLLISSSINTEFTSYTILSLVFFNGKSYLLLNNS